MPNDELLALDVDVLVLAAIESSVTEGNVNKVKAKLIVELANGPPPAADEVLYKKSFHAIPDFLCNAGGATVSCFEMVQNAYSYYWGEQDVHEKLNKRMTRACHEALQTFKKCGINIRKAAYVVAVTRMVEAMKLRGWV